ncbi:hypothetical protein T08_3175 [Trichinella sp. T8]|nr:hypothetical protein T08_3175 [Trichinella sp. T8]
MAGSFFFQWKINGRKRHRNQLSLGEMSNVDKWSVQVERPLQLSVSDGLVKKRARLLALWFCCQWLTDRPRGTIWCPAVISKAGGDLFNEHSNNDDQTASSFLHNSTNKTNSVHTRCDSACRVQSAWTPVNRADHPKLAPVAIGTLRRSIIIRPFSTFPHRTTQYKPP